MGTALYHHGEMWVDCPIHGEKTHRTGIDISAWQVDPKDVITFQISGAVAESIDITIMGETDGKELGSEGQETEQAEIRDASIGPFNLDDPEGDK
jgi:hypothetical protein